MKINLYKLEEWFSIEEFNSKIKDEIEVKERVDYFTGDKHGIISFEALIKENDETVKRKVLAEITSYVYYSKGNKDETDYSFINESFLNIDKKNGIKNVNFDGAYESNKNLNKMQMLSPEDKIIKKSLSPNVLFFINLRDENDFFERVVITFGHSFHKIKEYVSQMFPLEFVSSFDDVKFLLSEVLYPFSRTDKSLSSHDQLDTLITRVGSYITSMDVEIQKLSPTIQRVIPSKKFSISDSITFDASFKKQFESNKIEVLLNAIYEVCLISQKNLNKNKFPHLKSVSNSLKEELYSYLWENYNNDNNEIKFSQTGFIREDDGEVTTTIDYDNYYFEYKDKKCNGKFKIEHNLLGELFNFHKLNELKIENLLKGLVLKKYEDDSINKFTFWKLFDVIMEYKGKKYIHTNSKWRLLSDNIKDGIKDKLKEMDNHTYYNEFNEFDFTEYSKLKNAEIKQSKNIKKEAFEYGEMIFTRSLAKWLNDVKQKDSYVFDTIKSKDSKVEITDIIYNLKQKKDDSKKYVMSHVKIGTGNDEFSKNIDQSLTSFSLFQKDDVNFMEKLNEKGFYKKDIKAFEIMIVLMEDEYNSLFKNPTSPKLSEIRDRMISKLKLLEWAYLLSAENLEYRISFVKLNFKNKEEFRKCWKSVKIPLYKLKKNYKRKKTKITPSVHRFMEIKGCEYK